MRSSRSRGSPRAAGALGFTGVRRESSSSPPPISTSTRSSSSRTSTAWSVARAESPPCLAVHGLRHVRGGRLVLDDVSLDVRTGTVTALLGDSGSGKTSLLRCLVGLDRPVAGRVEFEGTDIAALDACTLRRRVALVGQTPVMLAGDVRSNLAFG